MDTREQEAAFFTAVTTEHFVMQTSIGATLSEAQQRASMFISVLTGALIAMGFVTQVPEILLPFAATVLPAVFVMGVITVLRLTDISMENSMAHIAIARARRHYRSLSPQAEMFFTSRLGRWPENARDPALRGGSFLAYWTSAASMVAAIDALVGAAAVTLLLRLGAGMGLLISLLAGGAVAAALLVAFFHYQRRRIFDVSRLAQEVDVLGS